MKRAIVLSALLLGLLFGGCICPGGGGTQELIPNTATPGEPIKVKMRAVVFDHNPNPLSGCYAPISGRFKSVKLYYRVVGEADWKVVEPTVRITEDATHETYEFVIPPYLEGTHGEVELYFESTFDGRSGGHPGVKKIALG